MKKNCTIIFELLAREFITVLRDLSCGHSNGDIFTCEDNMLFSHVKISSFRAKAHLVFHWCLHNNIFSPVPLLESRNVVPKSNFVFLSRFHSIVFPDKRTNTFCYRLRLKEKFLLVAKVCTNPDCLICTCKVLKLNSRKRFPCFHNLI